MMDISELFTKGDGNFWANLPKVTPDMKWYPDKPRGYFGTTEDKTNSERYAVKTILKSGTYYTVLFATSKEHPSRLGDNRFAFLGPLISVMPESDFIRAIGNHQDALRYLNAMRV